MKQLSAAILTLVGLILAACGTSPPNQYSWCYRFDFRQDDSMTLGNGAWQPNVGYITDNNNLLTLSYDHDLAVQPSAIRVGGRRIATGAISVQVVGNVFGVNIDVQNTIPDVLNDFATVIFPPNADAIGTDADVTIKTNGTLALEYVEIYGNFGSPFGDSNCGGWEGTATQVAQSTLTTATPVPSLTPFPTSMPTETELPTETPFPTVTNSLTSTPPTHTATPYCSSMAIDFDAQNGLGYTFAYGSVGASGESGNGVQASSPGAPSNSTLINMRVVLPAGAIVTRVDFRFWAQWSGGASAAQYLAHDNNGSRGSVFANSGGITSSASWRSRAFSSLSYTNAYNAIWILSEIGNGTWPSATGRVDNVVIYYCAPSVTPTPTSSNTPTLTRTPSPTRTPPIGGATFTPNGTGTRTPTRTAIGANSRTPAMSRTPLPTLTAISPIIATLTGTGYAPMPTMMPTGEPGEGGGEGEGDEDAGEVTIGNILLSIANWFFNTFLRFWDLIGQIINWLVGTARNFVTIIGNVLATIAAILAFILNVAREIIEIFGLLIQIAIRLLELLAGWVIDGITRIGAMITAFYNAPQAPIPGLPLCASDPTSHDLCAIYAIMDDTVLEPDSWGQFLVPIALINIDLWMLFYFAKFILKLLRRGETITNVG